MQALTLSDLSMSNLSCIIYGCREALAKFCAGVQRIVDRSKQERYFEHIGEYVSEVCALSCQYRVKVVPDFLQVAMALKVR